MDAIAQTPSLRLLPVIRVKKRHVDVQFEALVNHHIIALEIKRRIQSRFNKTSAV